MAEFLLKYADAHGAVHERVEDAENERALRDKYADQGVLIYSIKPRHSLGDSERRDWATDVTAISKGWQAGWLKLADIPKLFAIVGVELADDWQERLERMSAAPPAEPAGDDEDLDEDLDEDDLEDEEDERDAA